MNKYLVSTGTIPFAFGSEFTNYKIINQVVKGFDIDGLELIFLPEWDKQRAPLTPTSSDWKMVNKVELEELVSYFKSNSLQVPSIHVNRDVGNYLSSKKISMITRGQNILNENLNVAKELGAKQAVIHLWDTYQDKVNVKDLFQKVYEVTSHYDIAITFENIPISDPQLSVTKVWYLLKEMMPNNYGFTLDLNWCSLYSNFSELLKFRDDIYNIHVHGYLDNQIIKPLVGDIDILDNLHNLCLDKKNRYVTLELTRIKGINDFIKSIQLMKDYS